jgi:hypothetical protein
MSGYLPHQAGALGATGAALAAILLLGYLVTLARPVCLGQIAAWVLVVASVMAVERLNTYEPAVFRMLAIIGALLYAMKAVVAIDAGASGGRPLSWQRWLAFATLWLGMQPRPFITRGSGPLPGAGRLMVMGFGRLAAGAVIVAGARLAWVVTGSKVLATALLLPGLSLVIPLASSTCWPGPGGWRVSTAGLYSRRRYGPRASPSSGAGGGTALSRK